MVRLAAGQTIRVGPREVALAGGHYAYAGSALRGIEARVRWHLGKRKRLHWHIDYLLEKASVTGVYRLESIERTECAIALGLSARLSPVPGFGCSDCRCRSHLFFAAEEGILRQAVAETLLEVEQTGGINDTASPDQARGNRVECHRGVPGTD